MMLRRRIAHQRCGIILFHAKDFQTITRFAKLLIVLILPAILLTGCIDWVSQDFYFKRSNDGKHLYILTVYRGLHSTAKNQDEQLEVELGLSTFLDNESEVFAILDMEAGEMSKSKWKQKLTELQKSKGVKSPKYEAFLSHAIANINVRNGGFYLNKSTKRLDGWQMIQWRNVDEGVRLLNAAIFEAFQQFDIKQGVGFLKSIRLNKSKSANFEWIKINNSAIEIRIPMDRQEKNLKKRAFFSMFNLENQNIFSEPIVNLMAENHLGLVEKVDEIRIVIGDDRYTPNWLKLPDFDNKWRNYSNNLLNVAKQSKGWMGEKASSITINNESFSNPDSTWNQLRKK